MPVKEPSWWYESSHRSWLCALQPIANVVSAVVRYKHAKAKPYQCRLPVICVGNFTAGGTGKTPTVLKIAELVRRLGLQPVVLSRGYGGALRGPILVDPKRHTAREVGDEPLLLARNAATVVSRDRVRGALLIESFASPSSIILMDDGLQNFGLAKDFSLAVVDANRGYGNGQIIPAGPLRAPLEFQSVLADALLISGHQPELKATALAAAVPGFSGNVLCGRVTADLTQLQGERFVAYAGIANPERFFALLRSCGLTVVETRIFADHHPFTSAQAEELLATAQQHAARLITTEKDRVRLDGATGSLRTLGQSSEVLKIHMDMSAKDEDRLCSEISKRLLQRRSRQT